MLRRSYRPSLACKSTKKLSMETRSLVQNAWIVHECMNCSITRQVIPLSRMRCPLHGSSGRSGQASHEGTCEGGSPEASQKNWWRHLRVFFGWCRWDWCRTGPLGVIPWPTGTSHQEIPASTHTETFQPHGLRRFFQWLLSNVWHIEPGLASECLRLSLHTRPPETLLWIFRCRHRTPHRESSSLWVQTFVFFSLACPALPALVPAYQRPTDLDQLVHQQSGERHLIQDQIAWTWVFTHCRFH